MASSPPTARPGLLVLETNDHDVLFGRGKNTNCFAGNVYFRHLVADRAVSYVGLERGAAKVALAKEIVTDVQSKGGRFLRAVTAGNAKGERVSAWEVVTEEVVLAKVKQAMRDAALLQKRKSDGEEEEDVEATFASTTGIRHPQRSASLQSAALPSSFDANLRHQQNHNEQLAIRTQAALMQQRAQATSAGKRFSPLEDLLHRGVRNNMLPPSLVSSERQLLLGPRTGAAAGVPPFPVPSAASLQQANHGHGTSHTSQVMAMALAQQQLRNQRLAASQLLSQHQPRLFPANRIDRLLAEAGEPDFNTSSSAAQQAGTAPRGKRSNASSSSASSSSNSSSATTAKGGGKKPSGRSCRDKKRRRKAQRESNDDASAASSSDEVAA